MTANPIELLTLGHSNHAIERFLELLRRHAVAVVVDVRARPYSRFVPHVSRERLAHLLAAEGSATAISARSSAARHRASRGAARRPCLM